MAQETAEDTLKRNMKETETLESAFTEVMARLNDRAEHMDPLDVSSLAQIMALLSNA